MFTWKRYGGYEVSSQGDRRFSAFNARLADGRSIEEHYQCDIKGYQPGGTNWRLGKGKPPLDPTTDLWPAYLQLWADWAKQPGSRELLQDLAAKALPFNGALSDRFATTPVNQAHALAVILNAIKGQETAHA